MAAATRWTAAAGLRAVLGALLWVSFAGWNADYAVYGAVSVLAAVALSLGLLPPRGPVALHRWPARLWFVVVLVLWFLGQSVVGGVDVARRAMRRPVGISPEVVVAPIELPPGHARQLAMLMMNLMPGSMIQRSADRGIEHSNEHGTQRSSKDSTEVRPGPESDPLDRLPDEHVELHTLASSLNPADQWKRLQQRVHRAFR